MFVDSTHHLQETRGLLLITHSIQFFDTLLQFLPQKSFLFHLGFLQRLISRLGQKEDEFLDIPHWFHKIMAASHDSEHNSFIILAELEGAALLLVGAHVDGVRLSSHIEA